MSRKWLIPFCVGSLFLIFLAITPAFGQDTSQQGWTAPKFPGNGWWQSLALDQENNLHVAWYGNYDAGDKVGHDVLTYAIKNNDGLWSTPSDVIYTGDGGYTIRNALAVTSDGILHAAFRGQFNHYTSSAAVQGATNAENWSPQNQVGDAGYYLDMIAGQDDTLHLVLSGRADFSSAETGTQGSTELFAPEARAERCLHRDLWPGVCAERLGLGSDPFQQARLFRAGPG